ncbi:olfactory receptor 7D2-like [Erethizon dorsatum]
MEPQNLTAVLEFLLLGFSEDPDQQPILFGLFLSMYLVTVLGNLLIILAISSDSHLHTPMYFFLSSLSLADIGFSTTTIPKMLVNIHTHSKSITYVGCLTQVSFFVLFGCLESLLLTVMAYDCLVAICHPLHYPVTMSSHLCGLLVLVSFSISLLSSQVHCTMVSCLTFCTDVEIPHFFCDFPQLLKLTCSDTSTNNIVIVLVGIILGFLPISGIFFSYYKIISSILRVSLSGGRYKAFSTCGSHLMVVCLFYGTGLGVYLSSSVSVSSSDSVVASVMYTIVTPMLNPFIYSLRNKDIKGALWRIVSRIYICYMEVGNQTRVLEFILLGLSEDPELQPILFGLFLSMYLVTVLGNLLIILAVSSDSHLHTPMYFFISNLSFVDVCFSTTVVPKMLVNIHTGSKGISYLDCLSQVYFSMFFPILETLLLTVMAYDRFVAICHPLHYMVIMNPRLCGLLACITWFIGVMISLLHISLMMHLTFCQDLEIPHFFCGLAHVLKLVCSDTFLNSMLIYIMTGVLGVFPLIGILFSYTHIVSSLRKMSSSRGKQKAFSTCGSHLSVVSLFYGTGVGVHFTSSVTHSSWQVLIASVMYTVVTPMLNPFIYSLRNKDVKGALERLLSRAASYL